MHQTELYFEWAARQQNCTLTWDDRIALYRLILAVRPDLKDMIRDLSNYDLIEEAHERGIQHPLVQQYFPAPALAIAA